MPILDHHPEPFQVVKLIAVWAHLSHCCQSSIFTCHVDLDTLYRMESRTSTLEPKPNVNELWNTCNTVIDYEYLYVNLRSQLPIPTINLHWRSLSIETTLSCSGQLIQILRIMLALSIYAYWQNKTCGARKPSAYDPWGFLYLLLIFIAHKKYGNKLCQTIYH